MPNRAVLCSWLMGVRIVPFWYVDTKDATLLFKQRNLATAPAKEMQSSLPRFEVLYTRPQKSTT